VLLTWVFIQYTVSPVPVVNSIASQRKANLMALGGVAKDSITSFREDGCLNLSAAIAFYAVFTSMSFTIQSALNVDHLRHFKCG
jgi:hypothetical protein